MLPEIRVRENTTLQYTDGRDAPRRLHRVGVKKRLVVETLSNDAANPNRPRCRRPLKSVRQKVCLHRSMCPHTRIFLTPPLRKGGGVPDACAGNKHGSVLSHLQAASAGNKHGLVFSCLHARLFSCHWGAYDTCSIQNPRWTQKTKCSLYVYLVHYNSWS